jgi:lysophospholipase L1-like esterase
MRLLQTGERGKAPVLNRPHQDMLTGSGYLADGTDFDGFATPTTLADGVSAAASDATAKADAALGAARDYADAGDVEIAAAAAADATSKATAAENSAKGYADGLIAIEQMARSDGDAATLAAAAADATTKANAAQAAVSAITDTLDNRVTANEDDIATLQQGQAAGVLGYATKVALDADLAHADGTIAYVTNDATAAKNGTYRKSGASGAGSWVQSSYDRVALVEAQADASTALLAAIAAPEYPITVVGANITEPDLTSSNLSTFSGWGGPVGVRQNFNRITFYVRSWDATDPVTRVRVQVRENDIAGALLAEKVTSITVPNADTAVTVELDAVVANASGAKLYVMFWTDGKTGTKYIPQNTSAYPTPTYGAGRYSTSSSADVTSSSLITGAGGVPYFSLALKDYNTPSATPDAEFVAAIGDDLGVTALQAQADATGTLVGLIADTGYPVLSTSESLAETACAVANAASTFSGWGAPVGVRQNIDRVRIKLYPFDAADIPANLRLRIRETNSTGTILVDKTVALPTLPVNTLTEVEIPLDARIANAGGVSLWVMFWTDGKTGRFGKLADTEYPTPTYPQPLYSTSGSVTTITTATSSANTGLWVEFVTDDLDNPVAVPTDEFLVQVRETIPPAVIDYDADYLPAVPPVLYATEGVQASVYTDSLAHLESGFVLVPEVTCTKGRQLEECWRMTPSAADAAAATPWTLRLRRYGAAVIEEVASLVVTAKTQAAGAVTALCIGDSLTAAGDYTARMLALSAADTHTLLTLIGTQGTGTNKHEGRGGWTVARYNNESSPTYVSPFFFGGVFDFAQYLSTNSLATPDVVTIFLGVNDLFSRTEEDDALAAFAVAQFDKITTWITSIHSVDPTIKIGLCLAPMPAHQDGFDAFGNYLRQPYLRRVFLWNRAAIDYFGGRTAEGIYVIPTSCCLDTRYGYPTDAATPVFAHTTVTVTRQNNHVHPATAGYYQIGDTIWAALKGIFS